MELLQLYGPLALAVAIGLLLAWFVWGKGRTLKFICIGTVLGLLAYIIGWPMFLYTRSKPHYDLRGVSLLLGWYLFSLPAAFGGAILGYAIERNTRRLEIQATEESGLQDDCS